MVSGNTTVEQIAALEQQLATANTKIAAANSVAATANSNASSANTTAASAAAAAALAQAAIAAMPVPTNADWTVTDPLLLAFVKNKPPSRSLAASTRGLNTAFQISTTRDVTAGYSVTIACTLSLTSGQSGTVILEVADDSGFTTNVMAVSNVSNGNTGTLTIGLNLVQTVTLRLVGYIPAGKWVRLRTVNNTGTPSFTYVGGNELLM